MSSADHDATPGLPPGLSTLVLHEFLHHNATEIIRRTRAKLVERTAEAPAEVALKNGLPLFLAQLIDRLRLATTDSAAIEASAEAHGAELLAIGFTVSQVVHGYGDICQVITQLADETSAPVTADEFHIFNRCLDDAIAHAVGEYERRRDQSIAYEGAERLGILAHELRNRLGVAMLSFQILQEGTVAIGGSTGAVLGRSLRELLELVNNSLAGVRLESDVRLSQRVQVADFIGDMEVEARLGARAMGRQLTVFPVEGGLEVAADPQILSAAVSNLVQNALKFSRPEGRVLLRTSSTSSHVLIEVEDECGGLPQGNPEALFRPFEQRGTQRSGMGLGLSITRRGVDAMGGKVNVHDLPGKGCIFSIELPRLSAV